MAHWLFDGCHPRATLIKLAMFFWASQPFFRFLAFFGNLQTYLIPHREPSRDRRKDFAPFARHRPSQTGEHTGGCASLGVGRPPSHSPPPSKGPCASREIPAGLMWSSLPLIGSIPITGLTGPNEITSRRKHQITRRPANWGIPSVPGHHNSARERKRRSARTVRRRPNSLTTLRLPGALTYALLFSRLDRFQLGLLAAAKLVAAKRPEEADANARGNRELCIIDRRKLVEQLFGLIDDSLDRLVIRSASDRGDASVGIDQYVQG
jgi:hypothetical protein